MPQPVAVYSKKAADEVASFVETGKAGATREKPLFDGSLVAKDNIADSIAPGRSLRVA